MSVAENTASAPRERGIGAAILLLILISDPLQALQITAIAPALTSLKQHFDANGSIFATQMLMSMPGLGIVLAGWPAGRLIERFGALRILAWALPAYALCGAAGLLCDTLEALIFSRLLLGAATAHVAGAALSLIYEYRDPRTQPRLLSWQASLGAIAGLLSLPIAGWLAETQGWRGPFALYLLALLAWPAVLPRWLRRPTARSGLHAAAAEPGGSSRHLWPLLIAVVLVFAAIFMRSTFLPFLLAEAGINRPTQQALTLTFECLLNALGALGFSVLLKHLAAGRCLALCLLVMGTGNILLGSAGSLPLKFVGMGLSAAASGLAGPCLAYLVLECAGPAWRKRASGMLFTAIYLGDFLNPMLAAPLRHAFGLNGMFSATGLGSIAAGLVLAWRAHRNPA